LDLADIFHASHAILKMRVVRYSYVQEEEAKCRGQVVLELYPVRLCFVWFCYQSGVAKLGATTGA